MTTESNHYELAKSLKEYLLGEMAKYLNYSWSSDFIIEEMERVKNKVRDEIPFIDFACMNTTQLKSLGFKVWDEDSTFLLIPLWAYPVLKHGTTLHCIDGVSSFVHNDYRDKSSDSYIDNAARFGCLAYGIEPISKN